MAGEPLRMGQPKSPAPRLATGGRGRSVVASGSMSLPRSLALSLVALVVSACGVVSTTAPSPTPADFPGIATELGKRAIHVDHVVAGDAGCANKVLAPTAISFDGSGLDQTTPVVIYLYIFRNRPTFERLRASIDGCARSFVTDAETYESIEQSPFVLAGQGPWGPKFEAAVRAAVEVAAGTGG